MQNTGHASGPLAKKLGLRGHAFFKRINTPDYYWQLFSDLPATIKLSESEDSIHDCIHWFVNQQENLKQIDTIKTMLNPEGILVLSWPVTEPEGLTTDEIRTLVTQYGFHIMEIFTIDENWEAIKLNLPS